MTAACSTFEVGELARTEVRRFEHKSQQLARKERLITWFARRPVSWLAGFVTSKVDEQAVAFARMAVWFRGARDAVLEHERDTPLDPSFALVDQLHRMEESLRHIREASSMLGDKVPQVVHDEQRAALVQALRRMGMRADALLDEVRQFRGAVMAYEADRGEVLEGEPAASKDQFDRHAESLLAAS